MIKFLALLACTGFATLSHADLKATVKVTVTGGPQSDGPRENRVTITQIDSKTRVQREGESKWILIDGPRKFLVDDAAKTYAEMPTKVPSSSGSLNSTVKLTKKSETKTLQGHSATRFDLGGSLTLEPGAVGGGGGRAGRKRGGRRGGVGFGPGGGLSIGIRGTLWAASEVPGFSIGDALGERGQMLGTMGEQIREAGFVLEGNVEIEPPAMLQGRMGKMSVKFLTETIDQGRQDPDTFKWPETYRKVDPSTPTRRRGT